jgi:ABC-type phosphate transport system substrate-binding protein
MAMTMKRSASVLAALLLAGVSGCSGNRTEVSTTKGATSVACDESVQPVMQIEVDDFSSLYPDAQVTMRYVQAREAIADFINDSVRVIVSARKFNEEELGALKNLGVEYQTYEVALDAIVVVGHKDNLVTELRVSQLDSIFSGAMRFWPGKAKSEKLDVVIPDINSSVSEVFQRSVLKGKPYSPDAVRIPSSEKLLDYVAGVRSAIGIVGLSWLKGFDDSVSVMRLVPVISDFAGTPGQSFSPAQAYIYQKKYPLTRTVYMYNREVLRDVGLGFISHVSSAQGQKIFLNNGLVPVTMPVRIVELTSK